jgi:hypothetical protein
MRVVDVFEMENRGLTEIYSYIARPNPFVWD